MLVIEGISKSFRQGKTQTPAVRGVSFSLAKSEFAVLCGRSGSGKSTLLNLIGGLEAPDSGRISLDQKDFGDMTDNEISLIRRDKIGFIFQTFNLVPVLTAFENVAYALMIMGMSESQRRVRVEQIFNDVGLSEHSRKKPSELSGGQRQRVAIARALVKEPQLLLADEPTANLDYQTATGVMTLIKKLSQEKNVSVILCTHDSSLFSHGTRLLEMSDGALVQDRRTT